MASIKDYNRKIQSLKNTSKITRTMKMVSASKLRRAQENQRSAKQYAIEVNRLIHRLSESVDESIHPLLEVREEVKTVLYVVFTSDRGLCGAFNNQLIKFAEKEAEKAEAEGKKVLFAHCGRRGYSYFQKRRPILKHYENVTVSPDPKDAENISEELNAYFLNGKVDQISLIYNQFNSPLSQTPIRLPYLPLEQEALHETEEEHVTPLDFIVEPDMSTLLSNLIPKVMDFRMYYALLENAAGEHGARMTAMDNATNNAGNLIGDYTLLKNRARQAAITTELTEIISGAEAL